MNIYAIRDRMIDYFQQPFIAPDDKQVLAALATTINSGEKSNAIAQAPHHFELWKIGVIQEADVSSEKELIATLDSLIRGSVREKPGSTSTAMEGPTGQSTRNSGQRGTDAG